MSPQTLELADVNATIRIRNVAPPRAIFGADPIEFHEKFNRACFQFTHNLAGHPLFELPALLELSKTLPESDIYYDSGDIKVGQRWDQVPRTQLSVDQLIDRIENAGLTGSCSRRLIAIRGMQPFSIRPWKKPGAWSAPSSRRK